MKTLDELFAKYPGKRWRDDGNGLYGLKGRDGWWHWFKWNGREYIEAGTTRTAGDPTVKRPQGTWA